MGRVQKDGDGDRKSPKGWSWGVIGGSKNMEMVMEIVQKNGVGDEAKNQEG